MRKVVGGVIGAVLGYLVVALTLGWFVTNESVLALCYLAGVVAGGALGIKQASRRRVDATQVLPTAEAIYSDIRGRESSGSCRVPATSGA